MIWKILGKIGIFSNFKVYLNELLISRGVISSLAPLHSPKSAGALARWRFGHLLNLFSTPEGVSLATLMF